MRNAELKYTNYIEHYKIDNELFPEGDEIGETLRRRHEFIARLLPKKTGTIHKLSLLDIGTGSARFFRKIPKSIYPVGIDISAAQLLRFAKEYKNNFVVGDGYFLPFKSRSFDIVVINEVLEHTEIPLKVLCEAYRVLREGGKLIISTPYREKIRYSLCIHCNKPTPVHAHLHSFDENKLKVLLERAGFFPKKYYLIIDLLVSICLDRLKNLPFAIFNIIDKLSQWLFKRPIYIVYVSEKD